MFEFGQENFVLKNQGLLGAKNSFCLLVFWENLRERNYKYGCFKQKNSTNTLKWSVVTDKINETVK